MGRRSKKEALCEVIFSGCSVTVARVLREDLVPVQIRTARQNKKTKHKTPPWRDFLCFS